MKKAISVLLALGAVLASVSCAAITAEATTIKGDINGDNRITLRDATLIQKITVGSISPTSDQSYSGDFNSDGTVSSLDAFEVQKFLCLDKSTVDTYSPNISARIEFLDALNEERVANGLEPFEYNDAMLAAGHQRAVEVMNGSVSIRPDGSSFVTIFEEFNLEYNPSVQPYQFYSVEDMNGKKCLKSLKEDFSGENQIYTLLMSDKFSTICVGAIQCGGSSYKWVIVIN